MTIFRDFAISALAVLASVLFATSSLAATLEAIPDIDSNDSFIEGCVGLGACEQASVSGRIRLLIETGTGPATASLEYLNVIVNGAVAPSSPPCS